jgi:hypothetical protein
MVDRRNVDATQLDAGAAEQLRALVDAASADTSAGAGGAERSGGPPARGADRYQYELRVEDDQHGSHDVGLNEADMTPSERALVQYVLGLDS